MDTHVAYSINIQFKYLFKTHVRVSFFIKNFYDFKIIYF